MDLSGFDGRLIRVLARLLQKYTLRCLTIPAFGRVAETLIREMGYWDMFRLENRPSVELRGPDSPNGRLMGRLEE